MSTKTRILNRSINLFVTVLIVLASVPMAPPVATAREVPGEETPPARTSPGIRLFAVVDPPVVKPGAEAACTVSVVNDDAADVEGLTLRASLAKDLSPARGGGRTWQADVPPLEAGGRAEVTLPLRLSGRPSEAATFEIELRDSKGQVRATTTAIVGVETAEGGAGKRIDQLGGRFSGADGRVKVDFPPGALPGEASVSAKVKTQRVEPRGQARTGEAIARGGVLLQFSLEARDTAASAEIHTFAQPAILSVDLRGLVDAGGLPAGQHLYLAYVVDPETGETEDVEAAYDEETGLLTAEVTHFSEWEIGVVSEGWMPILTPPVPDLFSGAAVYRYPLQAPPGRNGLQPDLALSYNSRRIDTLKDTEGADSGVVALGWSLDGIPEITRYHLIKECFDHVCVNVREEFTLAIDGASYDLRPAAAGQLCGQYFADGAPGLYVERRNAACGNGAANQTTDHWIVRTPDGTLYRFGATPESELWIHQSNSGLFRCGDPDGTGFCEAIDDQTCAHYAAVRWLLDYVEGPQGPGRDVMRIQYRPNKTVETAASLSSVEKTMPDRIYYNLYATGPAQYASEVRFIPVANDMDDNGYTRIKQIDVYHLGTRVRQIALTTDQRSGDGDTERALIRIQELSGDGAQTLPPVEFLHVLLPNYGEDDHLYRRVSEINLGYGGRVAFSYVSDGRADYGHNYRVAETQVYDGISATPARVTYDYGQRCYDQNNVGRTNGGALCRGAHAYEHGVGPLVGHKRVTATAYDFAGTPVSQVTHRYYISDTVESPPPPHWLRGREYQTQVYTGDGTTLLQQADTGWAGDNHFSYLAQTISTDYTGGSPISTRTTYGYDPALQGGAQYGNLTHVREYGDGATPYRTTVTTYTVNPDFGVWIVGKPQEVKVYAGDVGGQALSWTESYYDYSLAHTPPVTGMLTLVKQIDPLSPTRVVQTRYAYDSAWGNLTDVWDPLSRHTGIAYDPLYHLYPLTATNALEQRRYVQYYGLDGVPADYGLPGQVRQVWDDNGPQTATAYTYDVFGRLAKAIRPGDSPALPTVAYWYDETTAATRVVQEYYSPTWRDHAYNSVANWKTSKEKDYAYQRSPFRVSAAQESGATPLHRYFYVGWHGCQHDTQYTTGGSPGAGWEYQGVLGYIWTSAGPGRAPLYQCEMHEYYTYDHLLVVGDEPCPPEYTDGGRPLLGYVEPATAPIRVGVSQRETSGLTGTLDSTVYYDGLGRQVQARAEAEGGQWTVSSAGYDALGRPAKSYLPRFEPGVAYTAPDGPFTLTGYDALGRAVRVDNADGTYAQTIYAGLTTTAVDADGRQKRYTNDVWGQLVQVEEYTGVYPAATLYATTRYGYDALGRLVAVTDTLGAVTTMRYDWLGRKDRMDDPDMGEWHYGYDDVGNLAWQTDAKGCTISFTYDPLNRLKTKSYSGTCSGATVTYFYDEPGYGYSSVGRRTRMTDGSGATAWVYDARGRVVAETKTIDTQTFTTQYTYDAADRPTTMTYPDGEVVATTYNTGGGLESLSGLAPYVTNVDVNPLGQIARLSYGNGVTTQYTYHPLNLRLENAQVSKGTSTLLDLSYAYDTVGNVQAIADDVLGVRQRFEYDDLDRLTRGYQEATTTTAKVIGEVGFIDDTLTHTPQTVMLSRSYQNPVVFATPLSRDGGDTAVVRITSVQSDRFTLYVSEAYKWLNGDVGSVGKTGTWTRSGITHTIEGGGADIWGTADEFHYVYVSLKGDGEIVARVASVEKTNSWAKAGVMIRETLSANSKHAFVAVTPVSGIVFQRRTATGGASSGTGTSGSAPYWVRLVRSGNTFTAYKSADGASWTEIGSVDITMGVTVYVGLAVTAHNDSTRCTAIFDNVRIFGDALPDGSHTTEAVSYVVLEAGSWTLPDGTRLAVGTTDTSATVGESIEADQWAHVALGSPFGATPVVVSQVQTEHDPHYVKTRQQNVTPLGFDVALEEEGGKMTPHSSETIGWLAIAPGTGTWSGHKYEAGQTADVVTHTWRAISFAQSFSQPPRFVAGIATCDGGDSAHLRYDRTSLTKSRVQVTIEEDTTFDDETNHTDEVVHYLAIEGSGTLTGTVVSGAPGGIASYGPPACSPPVT
jgi:YD repeat-containing protein